MHKPTRVPLTQLRKRAGAIVREVAAGAHQVIITDRGRPIAAIVRHDEQIERMSFRDRRLLPAFERLQERRVPGDSAVGISEDRERA